MRFTRASATAAASTAAPAIPRPPPAGPCHPRHPRALPHSRLDECDAARAGDEIHTCKTLQYLRGARPGNGQTVTGAS